MSKALKAKGFKFCGPVISYAFMQAVGMVNDHVASCFRSAEVERLARSAGAGMKKRRPDLDAGAGLPADSRSAAWTRRVADPGPDR